MSMFLDNGKENFIDINCEVRHPRCVVSVTKIMTLFITFP